MFSLTARKGWLLFLVFGFTFLTVLPVSATASVPPYVLQQKLSDGDTATAGEWFGVNVALSKDGKMAVMGAMLKKVDNLDYQGTVYVYNRTSLRSPFISSQVLTVASPISATGFGAHLALSEDNKTLLVAAVSFIPPLPNPNRVSNVYVFTRPDSNAPFVQSQVLTASNATNGDRFGLAIAFSKDSNTALIGAPSQKINNIETGAAYIFKRTAFGAPFSESQIITGSETITYNSNFGSFLDLSGDGNIALIGANNQGQTGAAYIFTRTDNTAPFSQTQVLTNANFVRFGGDMDLSDDGSTALIQSETTSRISNIVHVFTRTATGLYSATQQILAPAGRKFGYSPKISTDNNTFVVGSPAFNSGQPSSENVYFFSRPDSNSPFAVSKIIPSPVLTAGIDFGYSLDWSETTDTLLVGAYQDSSTTNVAFSGAAYVYEPAPVSTTTLTANANSIFFGQSSTFTATVSGTPYNNAAISGTLTFFMDNAATYTATLSGTNSVGYTANNLGIGQHSVYAVYNTGGNLTTSTSNAITLEIKSPFVVTESNDNGTATQPGTLSYALSKAPLLNAPITIGFALTGTDTVNLAENYAPSLPSGVTLAGTSCATPITIRGAGTGSFYLQGQNVLQNLQITGFQNKQLVTLGTGNKLFCVKVYK